MNITNCDALLVKPLVEALCRLAVDVIQIDLANAPLLDGGLLAAKIDGL